eukprot:TRINITY_DN10557_c0_g1_i1.p1 TRINITY_DN10557_c0_g1~~TRINITY_DN10557_c0_g1_i1.p1  ORF type:complete len:306 (+),score=81.17 TRINITY_DN10557_c0_g1_i1:57-920(+)
MSAPSLQGYDVREELGRGAFGAVHRVVCGQSGKEAAAKFLPRQEGEKADKAVAMLNAEMQALERATGHDHVLQVIARMEDGQHLVVITEILLGEDLAERVARADAVCEAAALRTFRQLVSAFQHLAAQGILHRDVKPANLMYASRSITAPVKVIDFGNALCVEPGESDGIHGAFGTLRHMSPEMMAKKPYGLKTDMWSLGTVLHLLLTHKDAYPQASVLQLRQAVKAGKLDWGSAEWRAVSPEARDLCQGLLCVDAARRLSAFRAARHAWCQPGGSLWEVQQPVSGL